MPAKSESQRRLMAAAMHGADFPKAKAIRKSMSREQMRYYAETPKRGVIRNVVDRKDRHSH